MNRPPPLTPALSVNRSAAVSAAAGSAGGQRWEVWGVVGASGRCGWDSRAPGSGAEIAAVGRPWILSPPPRKGEGASGVVAASALGPCRRFATAVRGEQQFEAAPSSSSATRRLQVAGTSSAGALRLRSRRSQEADFVADRLVRLLTSAATEMGCFQFLLLGWLVFSGLTAQAQVSTVYTNTQVSFPANLFTPVTVINTNSVFQTLAAPSTTANGYNFTHWTLNGVRVDDDTGRSANPVTVSLTNNVEAIAYYLPGTNYSADLLVPDWFKLEYFGTTNLTADTDSDLDGFTLEQEVFRGYHPRVADALVEGGISRRRGEVLQVITATNVSRVAVVSDPVGVYSTNATVTNGDSFTFSALPTGVSGFDFTGWFLGTNRVDNPLGFSSGTLSLTITNDTTLTARFLATGTDSNTNGLPDRHELYYFNTLTNATTSDADGDGFDTATEYLRDYQPNVPDLLVEGGISRRRGEVLQVTTVANVSLVSVVSTPPGVYSTNATVTNGNSFTFSAIPTGTTGFDFIGWFLDGTNRVDSPLGYSSGSLSLVITTNLTLEARFLPTGTNSNNNGLPDSHEFYYFNALVAAPTGDPDGDGFDIATEFLRGYQPNVPDVLVEGGVSRRRGELVLFVPPPPDFAQQPAGATNASGTTVTLRAEASGSGPFTYQWRLNGVNLVGQTNATLVIANAQATNSGSYSVAVASPYGANNSVPAPVLVGTELPGFALGLEDHFPGPLATNASRIGVSANVGATREAGEPLHAGKPGTNSVWLTWRAPGSGIVRVSTLGSGFDTLLGVYTGASASALERVASDDDSGGFYTSALTFNATNGADYYFAVDGLGGATGQIMLGWNLEVTSDEVPRIVSQTLGQTVAPGSRLPMQVVVESRGVPSFQWFKNGVPMVGADRDTLVLDNIQGDDAGVYQAAVWVGSRTNRSAPASIQVSTRLDLSAKDKLAELLTGPGGQGAVAQGLKAAGLGREPAGRIAAGTPATLFFNNFGSATERRDLTGTMNFDRLWFATDNLAMDDTNALSFEVAGVFLVETRTAAGVEVGVSVVSRGNDLRGQTQVGFATNSRPGVCRLAVPVTKGLNYFVVVSTTTTNAVLYTNDLVLGDGTLRIVQQPVGQSLPQGGVAPLRVLAAAGATVRAGSVLAGPEDLNYQWHKEGVAIPGATNATYEATSGGNYTVVVSTSQSNSLTSDVATVAAPLPVVITRPPADVVVNLGAAAELSVAVTGSGPLFFQWRRNGMDLPGAHGPTNRLDRVQVGDAGTYTVVVSNAAGAVTSSGAVLAITGAVPPSVAVQPESQTVLVRSDVTLTGSATGTAPLFYQWSKNGVNLLTETNASLRLTNLVLTNAGFYTVTVTNAVGVASSRPVSLVVTRALFHAPTLPTQAQLFTTGFPLAIAGELGRAMRVQASQDLTNWVEVMSFTSAGAVTNFLDASATNRTRRYYRVVGD